MRFPVTIELHRYNNITLFVSMLLHGVAAICVISVPWPWYLRALLFTLVIASTLRSLRPPQLVSLRLRSRGRLEGLSADCQEYRPLVLLPGVSVFVGLIVLRFRFEGENRTRSAVLFRERSTAERFRALRVWLRWEAVALNDGSVSTGEMLAG